MKRFFTLFLILIALTRWLNIANAQGHIPEPVPPPAAVREFFQLDPFYQQWIDVEGFPVIASAKVNPYAVKEAAWLIRKMIGHRRDILRALVGNKVRFTVIGYTEMTTDIPEYSNRRPAFYWDRRQRGSGGSKNSAVSCTEENLLDYPGDTASNAFQLIHEFAHAIHHMGLETVDTSFDNRLRRMYEAAMRKGLWSGSYAASNRSEYWAEGTHAWIDPNGGSSFERVHGGNTRAELKTYDPDLARLLTEIYGDGEWRYTPIVTRTHLPHLRGFDPQENPTFRWPEEVEETYAQLRDPNIESGDEWVNLNSYNPSQLSHLNLPRSGQTRTYVLLVNLADFDVLVYRVAPNGTETLLRRIHAQRGLRHAELFSSRVGDVYLIKDLEGRSHAVFQAVEQTGRALIGDGRPRNAETDNSLIVKITDPNLETALRKALSIPSSTPLTQQAMQKLTTLNVYRREVKNLTGLEYATELTELKLSENQIQDVTPLRGLTQLQELHLHVNRIQDITPIATLTELRELRLRDNKIRDMSALAGFTKLRELWISGNPIEDTAPLRTLLRRNPNLELDIEIPPPAPVVQIGIGQRPPMYWIDADAGTLHRLINKDVENILPNVKNATHLAVDTPRGRLYWTEKTSNRTGKIRRANLDGRNVQLVKALTSVLYGIALDATGGKVYLTNSWGKVQRLNVDGSNFEPNLITGLKNPSSLIVDAAGGKIYWIEQTSDTTGRVRRANLDGSNVQLVKNLTSVSRGLTLDTANRKLYLTNVFGKIQRLNLNGSNFQPNLITGRNMPRGISVDGVGRKVYWTEQDSIRRATLNGRNIKTVATRVGAPTGIVLGNAPTDAPAAPAITRIPPNASVLLANYPNPFNPETWIPYELATAAEVSITIYDIRGSVVHQLDLGHQREGYYTNRSRSAYWDGRNNVGEPVASGVYFYTLTAGDFTATRKLLILK